MSRNGISTIIYFNGSSSGSQLRAEHRDGELEDIGAWGRSRAVDRRPDRVPTCSVMDVVGMSFIVPRPYRKPVAYRRRDLLLNFS